MILAEPLLEATRDHLIDNLDFVYEPRRSIRVMHDERVTPYAGEEFIGVFGATAENIYKPDWIARRIDYGLTIGITRKLEGCPPDMVGEALYTYEDDLIRREKKSLLKRAQEVLNLVDGQWDLINRVREDLVEQGVDICVMTPLGFLEAELSPEEVYGEHFHITDDPDPSDRAVGLLLTLEFGGVQTYQEKP